MKHGHNIKHILVGTSMNLALLYNLNFTEVCINLKICYSLARLYVRCVYLKLFGWGGMKFMKHVGGGGGAQTIKVWEVLV
jgi:hypothetical protein